jgi:hypothetical protein
MRRCRYISKVSWARPLVPCHFWDAEPPSTRRPRMRSTRAIATLDSHRHAAGLRIDPFAVHLLSHSRCRFLRASCVGDALDAPCEVRVRSAGQARSTKSPRCRSPAGQARRSQTDIRIIPWTPCVFPRTFLLDFASREMLLSTSRRDIGASALNAVLRRISARRIHGGHSKIRRRATLVTPRG